ncbi:MAG TPA: hypothetical protein VMD51_12115, partial [Mycobacterium sp.]|nr:hypothetical protein [Mycobacterium sp.]
PARAQERVTEVITGAGSPCAPPYLAGAENLFAVLASDPEVTRNLSWSPHYNVEETRAVITGLFNVGVDNSWLITRRDSGELVEQIGYPQTLEGRQPRAVLFPNLAAEPLDARLYGLALR